MSTDHTTNYDLNQWEGTDKVLRTEFNADNAKIDAALKTNADAIAAEAAAREALAGTVSGKADQSDVDALEDRTELHPVFSYTLPNPAAFFTVDLSGIQWEAWRRLYLFFEPTPGSPTYEAMFNSNNNYHLDNYTNGDFLVELLPLGGMLQTIRGILWGNQSRPLGMELKWSELEHISLRTNNGQNFSAATKLTIWGEK